MHTEPTKEDLQQHIKDLEEKIEHLRVSRRVLMSLVERIEGEKSGFVNKLEKENRRLQYNNSRFAKSILNKNRKILELQSQLTHEDVTEI
jgi:predicted RNase H-like nuclease (RuvC/YqgF family)